MNTRPSTVWRLENRAPRSTPCSCWTTFRAIARKSDVPRSKIGFWFGAVCVIVVTACHRDVSENTRVRRVTLRAGQVALVGLQPITLQTIVKVQQQSGVAADEALEKLVSTQLIGRWAASNGLSYGRRRTVERGLLARVLLEKIQAQAEQPSQPTDAEVFEMTRTRWLELDRPEAWRVTHFVVMTEGTTEALALGLAQRIAVAVKGLTKVSDFIDKVRLVPAGGLKVVAESLTPVTADGRTFQTDPSGKPTVSAGTFDLEFARAAARLDVPGSQSSIIRTRFGFHVLLLEERIKGFTVPFDERKKTLWPEILRQRAQRVAERMLVEGRRLTAPQTFRAALDWTGHVKVDQ